MITLLKAWRPEAYRYDVAAFYIVPD